MTVEYLADVAGDLLVAAEAGLALATTGHAPPANVYVTHGPPTGDWCCEDGELVVWLETMTPQLPPTAGSFPVPNTCAILWDATYVIALHRCWPTRPDGKPPTPGELDSAATDLLADLWAILTELYDRARAGNLLGGQECKDVTFEGATIAETQPEGGCAGWEIRVTVRANDGGPVGS